MMKKSALLVALWLPLTGCQVDSATPADLGVETDASALARAGSEGLVRLDIPSEDPGPPFYARTTSILNQFFHTDGWLAIPFYRDPACIPPDFNMLELFDFPGPGGPGAFACPLLMHGFLLTEPDAPLGMFPRHVVLMSDAAPFWFVPWSDFEAAAADGIVTIGEIAALGPLTGVAHRYHETLKPREGDHVIAIQAGGTLDDGRTFQFSVMHLQDRTRSIQIRFR
jgi:hypothetical protein